MATVSPGGPDAPTPEEQRLHGLVREAEALIPVDADRAQILFRDVAQLARLVGDRHSEALALCLRGNTCFFTSGYPEARQWFTRALEAAGAVGHVTVQVRALSGLGIIANVQGDYGG